MRAGDSLQAEHVTRLEARCWGLERHIVELQAQQERMLQHLGTKLATTQLPGPMTFGQGLPLSLPAPKGSVDLSLPPGFTPTPATKTNGLEHSPLSPTATQEGTAMAQCCIAIIGGHGIDSGRSTSEWLSSVQVHEVGRKGARGQVQFELALPSPLAFASAAVLGRHLYVVGGGNGYDWSNTVLRCVPLCPTLCLWWISGAWKVSTQQRRIYTIVQIAQKPICCTAFRP